MIPCSRPSADSRAAVRAGAGSVCTGLPQPEFACTGLGAACGPAPGSPFPWGDCCAGYCSAIGVGASQCVSPCETATDCPSGCCVPWALGANTCAPATACASSGNCTTNGNACTSDGQCCSQRCSGGACQTPLTGGPTCGGAWDGGATAQCLPLGAPCSGCPFLCCAGTGGCDQVCGPVDGGPGCTPPGTACGACGPCCTGTCGDDGLCE
jgi:hypothetical protein